MSFDAPQQPPQYGGKGPSGPRAGFFIRLGALIFDALLLGLPLLVLELSLNLNAAARYGVSIVVTLAYYTFFEGSGAGQTLGKRFVGIRVIDYNTGGSIGYGRAAARYLASILSEIPLFLGFFWMLWDRERQCWHDKIVSSVVVPVGFYPPDRWP
jgi:uncharacterized RDD family membrane protein YckC